MTKILVIGSQGYLGTRLVEYLRDYGHAVQGMDIGTFQSCILDANFTEGHTSKRDALDVSREDIKGFDAVINLASNANDPTSNVDPER
jgi:nucleoside-diphosphate-sugar epimerase